VSFTVCLRFGQSDIPVCNRIDTPVNRQIVAELTRRYTDFRRRHEKKGMSAACV
jgi:hypothetical protein